MVHSCTEGSRTNTETHKENSLGVVVFLPSTYIYVPHVSPYIYLM